jgi:SAM-dependent methyltransferase
VSAWRNETGRPLSSAAWLDAHHQAKLPERTSFARGLAKYRPKRLVDLGCATGLWLDLMDKVLSPQCEFVGIDSDPHAIDVARDRARSWARSAEFLLCDIASEPEQIPESDLALAFNIFPYLPSASELLERLFEQQRTRRAVVRQYDGGTIRIGPMSPDDRYAIDSSLRASLESSAEFSHYDMDRTYEVLRASGLAVERLDFELTQRHAPFPAEFIDFFAATTDWMSGHLSDDGRARLSGILAGWTPTGGSLYFEQVDLVAVLSAAS